MGRLECVELQWRWRCRQTGGRGFGKCFGKCTGSPGGSCGRIGTSRVGTPGDGVTFGLPMDDGGHWSRALAVIAGRDDAEWTDNSGHTVVEYPGVGGKQQYS